MAPEPMGQAVKQQRVKAGVTQRHFEARTGGGIASKGGIDFVAQVFEEHRCHYVMLAVMLRDLVASAAAPATI